MNRRQSLDEARDFLADLPRLDGGTGVSFPVDGIDPDDTLYREYRALGMPASFFIDPQGVVTSAFNGRISLEEMEEALAPAVDVGHGPSHDRRGRRLPRAVSAVNGSGTD